MSYKKQGDLGVAAAIKYYMDLGLLVSFPLTDTGRYDLVVDKGTLLRVQVKRTHRIAESGNYEASLTTKGGNQSWSGLVKKITSDECDIVFISTPDGDWELPVSVVEGKGTITLGKKYKQYRLG